MKWFSSRAAHGHPAPLAAHAITRFDGIAMQPQNASQLPPNGSARAAGAMRGDPTP
ncbi:MAG: hypothetical protein AAF430_10825 [Myxococcota bacterium]